MSDFHEIVLVRIPREMLVDVQSGVFRMYLNHDEIQFGMMSKRTLGWTISVDRAELNVILEDFKMQIEYRRFALNSHKGHVSLHVDLLLGDDVMFATKVGRWSIPLDDWNVLMRELRTKLEGK